MNSLPYTIGLLCKNPRKMPLMRPQRECWAAAQALSSFREGWARWAAL